MNEDDLDKLREYFELLKTLIEHEDLVEIGELGLELIEKYETYENMDWPSEDW